MKHEKGKGIPLRTINWTIIILAWVLAVALLLADLRTLRNYNAMEDATEAYLISQQDANKLRSGSDYLTEQVRSFVVTGARENAEKYFEEINVTRRRDEALESLEASMADSASYQYLSSALMYSNELAQREYYAMRLAIAAFGHDIADYPEELRNTVLSGEDLALLPEAALEKARTMVFGEEYQSFKDRINENVDECLDLLISENQHQQRSSSQSLLRMLRLQGVLIAVLVALVFLLVFLMSRLIFRQLRENVELIRKHQKLPAQGVAEMQYLANAYNRMYDQTQVHQEQLSFEATHDSLTGLLNRSAFEKLRESMDPDTSALLLVDLDHFKSVNDTYGHDVGDWALKKLADILRSSFRSEDHICRIGGDEFAVIMVHADSSLRELVEGKIRRANEKLQQSGDGVPALSISVGVAFGDRLDPTDDIFRDADAALYRVKENGRCGCAFY